MEAGADAYQHEHAYRDVGQEEILVQGVEGSAAPEQMEVQ